MRVRLGMFLAWALIPCLASPVLGHGGHWKPPPPPPPPPTRLPGEPEPPPTPGTSGAPSGAPTAGSPTSGSPSGPSASGGGAPTGGSPRSSGPSGPSSPGRPAPVPVPGGAATGPGLGGLGSGRARSGGAAASDWLVWWELNRDDILDLRGRLRRLRSEGISPVPTGGADERRARRERLVETKVLPALRDVVGTPAMDADVRASALIALAKCGDLRDAHLLLRIAAGGATEDAIVEESAVLGLGMLGLARPECRDALVAVLDDTKRRWRTRAFAALSLGLLGDRSECVSLALDRCFTRDERVGDVPAAALLACGLLGDRSRVPDLCDRLDTGRSGRSDLSDVDRSRVADALGRIGDPAALPALRRALGRRGVATRRAAMTAMGRILPSAPADVRDANARMLLRAVDNESDAMAAAFGAIALGRIAAAADLDPGLRSRTAAGLLDLCRDGPAAVRPYAALALGLLARPEEAAPGEPDGLVAKLAEELRRDLRRGRGSVAARGALALALGMMGAEGALPDLVALLEDDGKDPGLRAAAALAVGLVGDPANRRPVLLRLMTEHDRDLRIRCATASALLGGREAVPLLLEVLADPRSGEYVSSSAAVSLGPFADPDSIEPLLDVLEADRVEGRHGNVTRAFAAVALGIIGARDDLRPVFRISKDLEFTSITAALGEVVTIL